MVEKPVLETVKDVFRSQNLGVLATFGEKYPYTSLVGFVCTEDSRAIVFATPQNTRKFSYLKARPKVSILINNGLNSSRDFKDAAAVTALGEAVKVTLEGKGSFKALYLSKFPFLEDFVNDPACAFIKVEVEKYIVVNGLSEVREFVPGAKL